MNKAEKLLSLCADTLKMPGWEDGLSLLIENAESTVNSLKRYALEDDVLARVAGGVTDGGQPGMPDDVR